MGGSAAERALTDPDKTAKVVVRRPNSGAWRRHVGRGFSRSAAVAVRSPRGPLLACRLARGAGVRFALAGFALLIAGTMLRNAAAAGDTRTLTMRHAHTGETITITYKRDGQFVPAALKKLDWFMRDWRRNEEVHMDPRLFDILWQAYRETGATQPIEIICGYRAPKHQSPAAHALRRRRQIQPAHPRQGDRLLHSRRTARQAARGRPQAAARRHRLLSEVRLALRAHGRRHRAALAGHLA